MNMYKTYTENLGSPGGYLSKLLVMGISAFSGISAADKRKWLMRANLTAFLIVLSLLQVSAASLAQKVTLKENNVSLEKVFREIRKQTGYDVLVDNTDFKTSKKINVNFVDAPLEKVMDLVVSGTGLTYVFEDKTVVIKEKSMVDKVIAYFANIDVTGRVVDEKGEPVAGATVKVKGTSMVTSSNGDGVFVLRNVSEGAVLEISYLGYQSREVKVSKDLGNVRLEVEVGKLEEVTINAGYYTVKDRERTGSISRITSKEIEKQPINNPLQALQGRVAGLDIVQQTGVPGGGFKVQIRGRNSIGQGNDPYYIIDGVPFASTSLVSSRAFGIIPQANPLSNIAPEDIESVEILKDADATAIYGSKGANGVILITTKRGQIGRLKTSVNTIIGVSKATQRMSLMNTSQYVQMRKEAFKNDNIVPDVNQYDVNGVWDTTNDTDWQDELIGGNASYRNFQASLSQGTENLKFTLGAAYHKEGMVFPGENSFARKSFNVNMDYLSTNKKFNASFSANYSQVNSDLFSSDLTQFIFLPPNFPRLLDPSGNLNWENNTMINNPLAFIQQTYDSRSKNLIGNLTLDYQLLPGLHLKTSFGYTDTDRKDFNGIPLISFNPTSTAERSAYYSNNSIGTWIAEPQLNFNKNFGRDKLNILLGTTYQQSLTDGQEVVGSGYNSDALLGNIASASLLTVQQRNYTDYRYTAGFGRVNYSLDNKYIANLTARRDGSSRFGEENRFANFAALGAAWLFSNENFFKDKFPFLNFGKLRGSYGITGSDQLSDYAYLELWSTYLNTYQGVSTISSSQISNPNFGWEVNRKAEIALDLGLFKDRISISTVFYNNVSSSQLLNRQLPPSTGFSNVQDNLNAKVRNRGWEFELNTVNVSNKKLRWATSVNLTIPQNKLLSYPDIETSGNDALNYKVGYPLSIIKTYNSSLDPATGVYSFEDYNKNGIINNDDRYLVKFLGRQYYGGIDNSFSFKGIDFDFLVQFVKQTGTGFMTNRAFAPGRFSVTNPQNNHPTQLLDRWQSYGDDATYQKYSTLSSTGYNNARLYGAFAIEDASFIRLKNISLSYTLPQSLVKDWNIVGAKFYVQGQNLFTLTKYKGLDPETQSLQSLPTLQVLSLGLKLIL